MSRKDSVNGYGRLVADGFLTWSEASADLMSLAVEKITPHDPDDIHLRLDDAIDFQLGGHRTRARFRRAPARGGPCRDRDRPAPLAAWRDLPARAGADRHRYGHNVRGNQADGRGRHVAEGAGKPHRQVLAIPCYKPARDVLSRLHAATRFTGLRVALVHGLGDLDRPVTFDSPCQDPKAVKPSLAAGQLPQQAACGSSRGEGPRCDYIASCLRNTSLRDAAKADIIVVVHSYLLKNGHFPSSLRHDLATLVVDENIVNQAIAMIEVDLELFRFAPSIAEDEAAERELTGLLSRIVAVLDAAPLAHLTGEICASTRRDDVPRMSMAAYARARQVDEATIRNQVRDGIIMRGVDGRIDRDQADESWHAFRLARLGAGTSRAVQAKTAGKLAKVQLTRHRIAELQSQSVDRAKVPASTKVATEEGVAMVRALPETGVARLAELIEMGQVEAAELLAKFIKLTLTDLGDLTAEAAAALGRLWKPARRPQEAATTPPAAPSCQPPARAPPAPGGFPGPCCF